MVDQPAGAVVGDGGHQVVLALEGPVERVVGYAGPADDVGDAGVGRERRF
jgi:hypothetical protein